MALPDYSKLSRQQKLAVFLVVIGPEAAAEILRQFDDTEIEALCREMSGLGLIPDAVQKQALEEFAGIVAQSVGSAIGGAGYAQRTVGLARGDYKAASIMNHIGPTGTAVEVVKDLGEMDGRQIFNLVKSEQPQTIALVLSYLEPPKAAEIFTLLSPDMREEVIERVGTIESTSLEMVGKIVKSMGKHFDAKARPSLHFSGGVTVVASLLNKLDKEMSKTLLARLDDRNAALGASIRKKMFSFEDISRLSPVDLQRVMREVDTTSLATAMKSATEPLREKIYAALSKRAAESLKDEIGMLGSVRLKDVEAAQEAVIAAVRRLEDEGLISLSDDANQMVGA